MKLADFWKRYRTLMISVVSVLIVLNFCGRMWTPDETLPPTNIEQNTTEKPLQSEGKKLEIYDKNYNKPPTKPTSSWLTTLWEIVVTTSLIGVLIYYSYTRGWLESLMPKWVAFKTTIFRDTHTHRLHMRLSVVNNTRESKTFQSPQIYFKHWQKSRRFNIKTTIFPLTLTPGTKQDIVIDIDQFWDKVTDLKEFKRVGALIKETGGKQYRTWARPTWLVWTKSRTMK